MLNQTEAQAKMKTALPQFPIKAWTEYENLYLFRVEFPFPGEENYDPFFSVDKSTGEVRDFSIFTDTNISEFVKLEWKEV